MRGGEADCAEAVHAGVEAQVLGDGEVIVKEGLVHHDADKVAHVGAAAGNVEAGDAQEAATGSGEAREGAEERRLAGAVGPEQGEDASPTELEVEASEDGAGAKPLGQARGADGRVGGGHR